MKRLLIYFSVLVGCLFIGLTTYYMVKNYETIVVTSADAIGSDIYVNIGDDSKLEIVHTMKQTELFYTISDESIISFNLETGIITTLGSGEATLTINTENEKYGPFSFVVFVGNGSFNNPFNINNAEDLASIGTTRTYENGNTQVWGEDKIYSIRKDIYLTEEWTPLCAQSVRGFTGSLQGNLFSIYGLKITKNQQTAGLFSIINDTATIDSLNIVEPYIVGRFDFAGVVAGASICSTISKVLVTNATILSAPYTRDNALIGGIVGSNQGGYLGAGEGEQLLDRGIITMCSFHGTLGTSADAADAIFNKSYAGFTFGGISGYAQGATIHNTKAEVNFQIGESLAVASRSFERLNTTPTGLCINVGGIVGTVSTNGDVYDSNSQVVGVIYPIIKNNLAIVKISNATTSSNGVIGHLAITVQGVNGNELAAQRVIGNYFYDLENKIDNGGSTLANATTEIGSETLLKTQSTYISMPGESWDINETTSAWILEENQAPSINLIGLEAPITLDENKYTISSMTDFINYYSKMTSTNDIVARYWLRQSYVLGIDLNLNDQAFTSIFSEWKPIGGDKFFFKGSFDGNGKSITFGENLNLINTDNKYTYAGMFGIISTEAEVKNLKVVGLVITYADYAGGIAGRNYGKITDCIVSNIQVNGAKRAGFITAINNGIIENTREFNSEEENTYSVIGGVSPNSIKINTLNEQVYAGSIAATNEGFIKNVRVRDSFVIIGETGEGSSIKVFGGAVGYNLGKIENSFVESASIYDYSRTVSYFGGFVGINAGTITKCHTGMEQGGATTLIYASKEEGNQVVGGFAAMTKNGSTISKSFANVSLEGYYTGGLAGNLLGEVSECYVKGTISGQYIGGLAVNLALTEGSTTGGHIANCYTTVELTGLSESSLLAGAAVYVRYPGIIEKCYVACTFSGEGEKYYESYTNTRVGFTNWIYSWARKDDRLGTITSVVINVDPTGTRNVDVKETKAIINYNGQVVKYLTSAECKEGKAIFEELGFVISSASDWTFEEEQAFPILTSVEGLDGVTQIIASSEEESAEEQV